MCPNCRAFITVKDRVCPYCEAQVGPRAIDLRPNQFAASFLPSANITAIIVLVLNVACFLAERAIMDRADPGVAYGTAIFHGHQYWRLISAGFLHAGWMHLAMNSWSLFILVTEVEQFFGTFRLIVGYVVSTITGFFLACFFSGHMILGASCAAFGLMGIMLSMGVFGNRADPLIQLIRQHYGQWLVFGLIMSLYGNISLLGHIGGLIGGFLVGAVARLPGKPDSPREMFWKIAAFACVALVVYCWYQDFANISHQLHSSVQE